MFDSQALEVAIGLVLVFLLVSLALTAVRECVETFFKSRAVDLEHAIAELLDDRDGTGIREKFYSHPLVFALFPGNARLTKFDADGNAKLGAGGAAARRALVGEDLKKLDKSTRKNLPSYIPREIFSTVLEDLIGSGDVKGRLRDAYDALLRTNNGDLVAARKGVEGWYDAAMDRASGWYRRRSQIIVGMLGVVLAVLLNINAVTVGRYLATNSAARAQAVALAGRVDPKSLPADSAERLTAFQDLVAPLSLPVGWNAEQIASIKKRLNVGWSDLAGEILLLVAGYLIVGFAATLGAPFWFDVLGKIMVVRSTVKPREKSPDEASKDAGGTTPAQDVQAAAASPTQAQFAQPVVDRDSTAADVVYG